MGRMAVSGCGDAARVWAARFGVLAALAAAPAAALDDLRFRIGGDDAALSEALRAASAVASARQNRTTAPQDILAAARAEYGRLLGVLYARGHYSGVIRVLVDGREAAAIPPLDAPARIGRVEVIVDPGPAFAFGVARVAPLAPETALPPGFTRGAPAESGVIAEAASAGVDGWRARGHARARVAAEDILADHRARRLDAEIRLDPGPRLRFGPLAVAGNRRMRTERILAIAGLPEGRTYSPETLDLVATRLRRTGVFRSVALTEDRAITPPDLLGITATVVEERPRRYSFGAEFSSLDGASVTASWMHRNLRGGGERLRIEGGVGQIGAQNSGTDYTVGVTLDRPATFGPDITASVLARLEHLDEEDYLADTATLGLGLTRYVSQRLTLRAGLRYAWSEVEDDLGTATYRTVALPLGVLRDDRDAPLDARRGSYLDAELKPFAGLGGTDSGLRLTADGRAYRSLGNDDRVTFAGRLQLGAITGSSLLGTPRTDLFHSGGGGTVRGQPYQSLGITLPGGEQIGGMAFLGASAEARVRVTRRIGVVAFADWGHVGGESFFDDLGGEQAGAGLGLRYDTGFGPIRLDVAAPVSGKDDEGVQIYLGIGQAF